MATASNSFDVAGLLQADAVAILDEASGALDRSHLPHYDQVGADERRARLQRLLELVTRSIADRDLMPIVQHAEEVARQRFDAGVDIGEVQAAFNVLEEVLWRRIVAASGADDLADAVGMLSTVLGAGKDHLARTYVALATHRRVPSLDLTALFRGAS